MLSPTTQPVIPEDEECAMPQTDRKMYPKGSRLSTVSQMYDLKGKGYLDETEQELRNLDTSNKGQLSKEKMYELMQSQINAQREVFKLKRVLCAVGLFAILLAATTLATSFAAANLAKDSSVALRDESLLGEKALRSKDGSVAIGVHTIGHEIFLEEHDHGGGPADHACANTTEVAAVWEEIAAEFEVHLVLVRRNLTDAERAEAGPLAELLTRDLIPLTGAKSFGDSVCFTSGNELAMCAAFNDTSCRDELGGGDLVTLTFPNSKIV